MSDKLIICVCPTGSWLMKDFNPNVAIQPDEIAEEVYRCQNEGASMVHIHARDRNGQATTDAKVFSEIDRRIRERGSGIIIQHSTSPGRGAGQRIVGELKDVPANLFFGAVNKGLDALEPNPEMGSLDIGVGVLTVGDEERINLWTRGFVERAAAIMLEKGIKPELEVYNVGGMVEVDQLIKKGLITAPYWISFCLGMERTVQGVTPFTPRNLMHLVDLLPKESLFTALGIGPVETQAVTQSILLGGHARVGFEDNPYLSKGILAKSNA
ncbi:MAG: 3-keto-5-aminohexanoate cleavage protein, partial [Pseudomonadota bacterium]